MYKDQHMVACMVPSMNARGKETRAGEKIK